MEMNDWVAYFHWSFIGESVLLSSIRLQSFPRFLLASLLAICVCVAERCLSKLIESKWEPPFVRHLGWQKVAWRATLYWLTTFMGLAYMLIAMTFHLGLILVMVTTLTVVQMYFELNSNQNSRRHANEFVTGSTESLLDGRHHPSTSRPRSRSKPDDIFIHPNNSNLARADAVAVELGLSGDTERVHKNRYDQATAAWTAGEGRDVARTLLGAEHRAPEQGPFRVAHDSEF